MSIVHTIKLTDISILEKYLKSRYKNRIMTVFKLKISGIDKDK